MGRLRMPGSPVPVPVNLPLGPVSLVLVPVNLPLEPVSPVPAPLNRLLEPESLVLLAGNRPDNPFRKQGKPLPRTSKEGPDANHECKRFLL